MEGNLRQQLFREHYEARMAELKEGTEIEILDESLAKPGEDAQPAEEPAQPAEEGGKRRSNSAFPTF
ncbi:hypothetical protein QW131_21180 [Roseibium salinum]|nr:hypothetical protein [Roseibium salinum]